MSTTEQSDWTLEITPRNSLLYVPWSDVWRYRDLLALFVRRDFVAFYKQTILGPAWFFIQPLLTTLMFMLLFGRIAGLETDGIPHVLFYLAGVTFWNYFAECLNKTATVFKDNAQLFGKVYFPRIIIPLSIVLSNLVRFAVQFALFLAVLGWFLLFREEVKPRPAVIAMLPVLVFIMATLGLGLGMLFSAMTTKYRDLAFLLQFGVQLLMYASSVIIPFSLIQESPYGKLLQWNPLIWIIEAVRYGFLGQGCFQIQNVAYAAVLSISIFLFSCVVFNRVEKTFMDTV